MSLHYLVKYCCKPLKQLNTNTYKVMCQYFCGVFNDRFLANLQCRHTIEHAGELMLKLGATENAGVENAGVEISARK